MHFCWFSVGKKKESVRTFAYASKYQPYINVSNCMANTVFTLPLETEPEWYHVKNCTMLAAYWQHSHCNY